MQFPTNVAEANKILCFFLGLRRKDIIFAVSNIFQQSSESALTSVVGILCLLLKRDIRFRTPVGSINVPPAFAEVLDNGLGRNRFLFLLH